MPQNRDVSGRFVKGHSGNPGGRKAMPKSIKEALAGLVPEALQIKKEILSDPGAPLELKNKVADSILDRVYGRPGLMVAEDGVVALEKLDKLLEDIGDAAKR